MKVKSSLPNQTLNIKPNQTYSSEPSEQDLRMRRVTCTQKMFLLKKQGGCFRENLRLSA